MSACPCGTGAPYEACCGPRHAGTRPAETAEALMRSRYSAFARGDADYLARTTTKPTSDAEKVELATWAKSVAWLGLEVLSREQGRAGDETGVVEFVARYLEGGHVVSLRERSRFSHAADDLRWVYVDGSPTVTKQKVERNAPCPCGSGKKFKQCHA